MKTAQLISFDRGEFSLVAENDLDRGLLRRILDLRKRCSVRAHSWEQKTATGRRGSPEITITAIDWRLAEDSGFEPIESPHRPAKDRQPC
jgi:hypothetical protein